MLPNIAYHITTNKGCNNTTQELRGGKRERQRQTDTKTDRQIQRQTDTQTEQSIGTCVQQREKYIDRERKAGGKKGKGEGVKVRERKQLRKEREKNKRVVSHYLFLLAHLPVWHFNTYIKMSSNTTETRVNTAKTTMAKIVASLLVMAEAVERKPVQRLCS